MASITEPWHIRYVSGDRIPDAVLAYEDSLKPKPPPPPPPVVPPTPPKVKRMFVCVGNGDDKGDPRRWAYDGFECRLLVDGTDYNEISLFWGWMGSTLTSPHWKPLTWIQALGG